MSTIKSFIPQKQFYYDPLNLPCLNNTIYGILSYDGPIIAICDIQNKQILKGYFIRREGLSNKEFRFLRVSEVLVEACPISITIYPKNPGDKTYFEIE